MDLKEKAHAVQRCINLLAAPSRVAGTGTLAEGATLHEAPAECCSSRATDVSAKMGWLREGTSCMARLLISLLGSVQIHFPVPARVVSGHAHVLCSILSGLFPGHIC